LTVSEIHQVIVEKKPRFVGINIFSVNYVLVKKIIETYIYQMNFIVGAKGFNKEIPIRECSS